MTNTIRPYVATTLRIQGEVQTWESAGENCRGRPRKSATLGGQRETKSDGRARQVFGDGMHGRSCDVNQGDLLCCEGSVELCRQESEHP